MELTSTIVSLGAPQPDGRFFVKERHVASNGQVVDREYLNDGALDPQVVLAEARAVILAKLNEREAARALVVGLEVPRTKHDFLELFSSLERQSIRRRAETDANVRDFMEMLAASGGVYKTKAWPGLQYLAHIGEISWERADAIAGAM